MPHGSAGGQFRYMVEYGMTPMEAIQSATRNAAQALGREADVGAIAAGRYGDIVAVDGDPLADVRELENVDVVIKGGEVVSDRRQREAPAIASMGSVGGDDPSSARRDSHPNQVASARARQKRKPIGK